jgi:hypothetical protein
VNRIAQIGAWVFLRAEDGENILLQRDGRQLDGVFTLESLPEELGNALYLQKNLVPLVFLINYAKLCDRFLPIITRTEIEHYAEGHKDSPEPELPECECSDGRVTAVTYSALASIRGNPLYVIKCACPIAKACKCSAYPAI